MACLPREGHKARRTKTHLKHGLGLQKSVVLASLARLVTTVQL